MPYIPADDRVEWDPLLDRVEELLEEGFIKEGDLNYFITSILGIYLDIHGESYTNYNKLIGLLECIKLEFYRKAAAPYEDIKESQNGRVL